MIHDPIFLPIRTRCEASVAYAVGLLRRILVKYAALGVLPPVLDVHRVRADKFKLTEAVVAVVGASSRIDDEVLAGFRVDELLGTFV